MTRKTRWLIIVVSVAVLVAVSLVLRKPASPIAAGPELPIQRPTDLVIAYSYGTAMTTRWSSAFLSEKQSYTELASGPTRNKVTLAVTPQELDSLYAIFRANRFSSLTHTTQEIYDGSAGTISLTWSTTTVAQPLGDSIVMSEKDQSAMDVVWQALQSFIQKKMAAISVPIQVRTVGIPARAEVEVSIDDGPDLLQFSDAAHFVPGQHRLHVDIRSAGKPTYTLDTPITTTAKPSTLTISLKNETVYYTLR